MLFRKKGEQFFDDNGLPLVNGYIVYFDAGTNNAATVYQDAALSVLHPEEIALDAAGRLQDPIYFSTGDLKEILYRDDDSQVFSEDNYPGEQPNSSTGGFALPKKLHSTDEPISAADDGKVHEATPSIGTTITLTLPDAATCGDGWAAVVRSAGAGRIRLVRSGSNTINGGTEFFIDGANTWALLTCDGAAFAAMPGHNKKAGQLIQSVSSSYSTYSSHTDPIPVDDTLPVQSNEGDQIMSASITLQDADNVIRGTVFVPAFGATAGNETVVTVFRGTTCIAVARAITVSAPVPIAIQFEDAPASAVAQTYSVRVGTNGTGTSYVNGNASARLFGGASKATLEVREIAA